MHYGPTLGRGDGVGWYLESRARCDWQSMTFLSMGTMPDLISYVGGDHGDYSDYFTEPYRADIRISAGAVNTGYSREDNSYGCPKTRSARTSARASTLSCGP